jgi:ubiquinone biosynthesis protein COQ9
MITPPERLPERDAAIEAMLPSVPFDGWTKRALRAGVAAAGMPADEADLLFPLGTIDMIVRAVIALRLEQNRPHKEAIRRAVAILALPRNAGAAAATAARTVDAIWHAAGDRSADFSWYTKRAILTAVYTATILYWLRDQSLDDEATLAFLDRRLAGIGRTHRLRKRLDALIDRIPRPGRAAMGDTA